MVEPKPLMRLILSVLIQSGIKMVTGCPSALPMAEMDIPVFPLVASMMGFPGFNSSLRIALRNMCKAIRSLILPVMFRFSAFAKILHFFPLYSKSSSINGVFPIKLVKP